MNLVFCCNCSKVYHVCLWFCIPADNAANTLLATATALSAPLVFGDERDAIMTKWNQIQAFWGVGRGFYRKDGTHVTFNPQNHFCRFKVM